MKLSTRARYGLRGLFDIAYHNLGRPTHVKDIARRQDVTPRYLEQIFQVLKKEGIVSAQRGPRGGYYLGRPAEEITVGDIVRATEGPIKLDGDAREGSRRRKRGSRSDLETVEGSRKITSAVWSDLAQQIEQLLDATSLTDLCTRAEADGLPREADTRRIMYFI